MTDNAARLRDAVAQALEKQQLLSIAGSGSKSPWLRARGELNATNAALLSTSEHSGIETYHPAELVMTARAGTKLTDVEHALAENQQMLPFEPPRFRGAGSWGGVVATGLSGPSRPWWGSVRDAVLGVEMINGAAEHLRFGGQVMKNVAGYDASRLQVGAYGAFGPLLSVSVKVVPVPQHTASLVFACSLDEALAHQCRWASLPLPISATCFFDQQLYVRLSGAESAVVDASRQLGGESYDASDLWVGLRDQTHDFFSGSQIWRVVVPAATPDIGQADDQLVEWGGALRWLRSSSLSAGLVARVYQAGGFVQPYRGQEGATLFTDSHSDASRALAERLKTAFDPQGIFNPGVWLHAN